MTQRTLPRFIPLLGLVAATALALSGCSAPDPGGDGELRIVASTNVYGDIAEAIAGDHAAVTSIIEGSTQDPHSYEATVQNQLALSKADIVIENGGGYDPFIDTMLASLGGTAPIVLSAVELSGLLPEAADEHDEHDDSDGHAHEDHDHIEGFNEHVWYSFAAMDRLAAELSAQLAAIDPANAADYDQNYKTFTAEIAGLETTAAGLRAQHEGAGVAITEPVPLYLFETIGLINHTPDAFSTAIEDGTDVAPAVLLQTLDTLTGGEVRLLAYNEQTAGPETEQLLAAAAKAGVAVVSFTETLPQGENYGSWMAANLAAVGAALA